MKICFVLHCLCRMQDLEAHSKTCSSPQSSPAKTTRARKSTAPRFDRHLSLSLSQTSPSSRSIPPSSPGSSTASSPKERGMGTDYLVISVTRSPPGTTDLSPFKIITKVHTFISFLCVTHPWSVYVYCNTFSLFSIGNFFLKYPPTTNFTNKIIWHHLDHISLEFVKKKVYKEAGRGRERSVVVLFSCYIAGRMEYNSIHHIIPRQALVFW